MSIKTKIPAETLDLLGRFEAHALDVAARKPFVAFEGEAAERARRFVIALQAVGVDQWPELTAVLTSLFLTQLRLEQGRRDTLSTLVAPTPN
jgi:hypothetical protein